MIGEIIGRRWRILSVLGEGGNSMVYNVVDILKEDNGEFALKVIPKKGQEINSKQKKRLQIEIDIQKKFTEEKVIGVLPLLEYDFPESPTYESPVWICMPIAETMRIKMRGKKGNDLTRSTVVAILDIARVLLKCSSLKSGFLHRDIKPENIFFYNGGWCIGDFGLIDFIGKESISESGDRIGSHSYIAPECLGSIDEFTEKSEVWSLAKTLFAQAKNEKPPVQGPHHINDKKTCLQPENEYFIMSINHLLQKATENDGESRISLAGFINDLENCLKIKTFYDSSDVHELDPSCKILYEKKVDIIRDKKKTEIEKDAHVQSLNEDIYIDLNSFFSKEISQYSCASISRELVFLISLFPYCLLNNDLFSRRFSGTQILISGSNINPNDNSNESLKAGIQIFALPENKIQIFAAVCHFPYKGELKWSFGENRIVEIYSSEEKIIIQEAISGLKKNFLNSIPDFVKDMCTG